MERKFYFNVRSLMAVATTVCLFASGCGSNATTSSDLPPKSNLSDVTAPMVTFEKMSMTIAPDKDFDPLANIISVKDAVDGDLEYVEGSGSKAGKYTVKADDMTKVGYHAVTVTATDSSGNKAVRYYQVKVTEDKKEVAESEKAETASETKKDTSSSDSKSSSATKSSSALNSSTNKSTGNSSSTSKPSTGSSSNSGSSKPSTGSSSASKPSTGSGTASSGSTSKPSTGGSTSSGSSSASKPSTGSSSSSGSSTGSGSSGSSSGSTAKPAAPTCKAETIYHPAETHTVHHDAEYTTVHHDAITTTEWVSDGTMYKCNECGELFTFDGIIYHTMSDPNSPCDLSSWTDIEQGHYETVTVKDAYDEQVLVKEAWDETVTDKEAWTETKEVCA